MHLLSKKTSVKPKFTYARQVNQSCAMGASTDKATYLSLKSEMEEFGLFLELLRF